MLIECYIVIIPKDCTWSVSVVCCYLKFSFYFFSFFFFLLLLTCHCFVVIFLLFYMILLMCSFYAIILFFPLFSILLSVLLLLWCCCWWWWWRWWEVLTDYKAVGQMMAKTLLFNQFNTETNDCRYYYVPYTYVNHHNNDLT